MAGGLAGLLLAVLAFVPATWAARALAQATDGRVQLMEPRGTLWDGSGQLQVTGGEGSRDSMALPSRLAWRLRPAATGLSLSLQADCCTTAPLTLGMGWRPGRWVLRVDDGPLSQWPAAVLAGLGTPWNTLDLEGRLQLQTRSLRLQWDAGRLQVDGSAEVSLLDASSRLATVRPLGSYRMRLVGGDVPGLQLETLEGALQIQGQGQWVGDRLRFTGEAKAEPGREPALDNLLNIIGRRDGTRAIITLG